MTVRKKAFLNSIEKGYAVKGDYLVAGAAIFDGEPQSGTQIKIPLKTLNRHGLIAGSTGTGKTKTLQGLAESMSEKGIPVLMMDLKGDLSGLAAAGKVNEAILERHKYIGIPYEPKPYPVEFMSLSNEKGVKLRATVSEFGPVLFSKILGLNDTQSGIVALMFKFCDDERLPLLDLKDFKKVLQYIAGEGKDKIKEEYGAISTASASTILRKIIELEQQGADKFFGELSFDVADLVRKDDDGNGYINIIRLTDIQDKPKLFSTFMLSLLAEIYATFPEAGDLDKPKLVIFIDEAHLIFKEASPALLNQIESIIKLIRSKSIGIFFCTQNPSDVPDAVLGQLGLKVQHALRAFTAKDRKMIKLTAENYPISEFYKTEQLLTSLGIGEAAITVLSEKGIPSPLAATLLKAPRSRMDVLSQEEIDIVHAQSELVSKYNEEIDRESAFEILSEKLESKELENTTDSGKETKTLRKDKNSKSTFESVMESTMARQIGRTIFRELTRGLLGVLGVSTTARRKTTTRRKY
jgi:DNA helicase HerA-like ATPase